MQSSATPNYAQAVEEATKLFKELLPVEQWKLEKEKNGTKIYTRKDKTSGLKMARGDSLINAPAAKVFSAIEDCATVLKWDDSLATNDSVEKTGEYDVVKSLGKKQTLVTQRETLIVTQTIKNADGSILCIGKSVEHPSHICDKKYVRAQIDLYVWSLTPSKDDANKTEAVYMIYLDPKGMIPSGVFNAFVEEQAANAQKVKDFVEKQ